VFQAISEGNQIELDNQLRALEEANNSQISSVNATYNAEIEALRARYEQGLIGQEQYNKASQELEAKRTGTVDNLNKALNAKTLAEQKKAFENQKKLKIAEATINGIQGALTAFTSAFQLGPIAGPIVGGILAALVAATTGVQIANIKKTQFDSITPVSTTAVNPGLATGSSDALGSAISQASSGGFTSFTSEATGGGNAGAGGATTTPMSDTRVYVLESDITNTQNRVRTLESNASFG